MQLVAVAVTAAAICSLCATICWTARATSVHALPVVLPVHLVAVLGAVAAIALRRSACCFVDYAVDVHALLVVLAVYLVAVLGAVAAIAVRRVACCFVEHAVDAHALLVVLPVHLVAARCRPEFSAAVGRASGYLLQQPRRRSLYRSPRSPTRTFCGVCRAAGPLFPDHAADAARVGVPARHAGAHPTAIRCYE